MTQCIDWPKSRDRQGYGYRPYQGKTRKAHRVAYCEAHGLDIADIEGQIVRHTCDRPSCVNPDRLLLGTCLDNARDRKERGRSADRKGTQHGQAQLTEEKVRAIRNDYTPHSRTHGSNALGKKYGVHPTTVRAVIRGKSWAHIT